MTIILLRLAPLFLLAGLVWLYVTASRRTTRIMRSQSRPLRDRGLEAIIERFAEALEAPGFEVRLLDWRAPNGFATPDGEIYLTRGMYEKHLDGELTREEIAAVVAHEIGHVALGHARARLTDAAAHTATWAALVALWMRALFGWFALLGALVWRLFRLQKQVDAEFEADAFSVQLMERAGYDPRPVASMLRKADAFPGVWTPRNPTVAWLLGAPTLAARIERVEQAIAAGSEEPAQVG